MTRFYLTLMFTAASLAGLAMILYAFLTRSRSHSCNLAEESCVELGFSDPASGSGAGILDLDIGHEGLTHRGKEAFDPGKHKPQPL